MPPINLLQIQLEMRTEACDDVIDLQCNQFVLVPLAPMPSVADMAHHKNAETGMPSAVATSAVAGRKQRHSYRDNDNAALRPRLLGQGKAKTNIMTARAPTTT